MTVIYLASTYICVHVKSGTSAGLYRLEVDPFVTGPVPLHIIIILSSGTGNLGGNGLIDPPCPAIST